MMHTALPPQPCLRLLLPTVRLSAHPPAGISSPFIMLLLFPFRPLASQSHVLFLGGHVHSCLQQSPVPTPELCV